jgi:hypothetical protein
MSNKIALIVPYFGKTPSYFPLFMNSVRDKAFDVLFFSDIDKPGDLPNNVIWNSISFDELKVLFNSKLDMETLVPAPYKVCDFRPAFGIIFESYLGSYQFWGSVDVDTIIGGFSDFITEEMLEHLDVYSGVREYLSGSFFFIRNNNYCNTLFKKSKDWIKAFTNEKNFCFDECGGPYHHQLQYGANIFHLRTEVQSFTEIIFLEAAKGSLRALFTDEILEPKGLRPILIELNNVKYLNRSYLLLHFIYLKTRYYFTIDPRINIAPYYINSLGNFKYQPNRLNILFSKNLIKGIFKKIEINLNKLKKWR